MKLRGTLAILASASTIFHEWEPGVVKFDRVAGDAICEICGERYAEHPEDLRHPSYDGQTFLHVGCDGRRLKT